MSVPGMAQATGTFEQCVDELNDFVVTLADYPQTVVAFAMRTHLAGMLRASLDQGECTHVEARDFLAELESEVLGQATTSRR